MYQKDTEDHYLIQGLQRKISGANSTEGIVLHFYMVDLGLFSHTTYGSLNT